MQPSSLIFLVIIGIWAAYFVQYWVRRREHLATIRSVDAFSETMRVLQRRSPLPSLDTGSQSPRTYAVSPARAMRPQVTVKRAEAHVMQRDVPATSPALPSVPPAPAARERAHPVRGFEPHVASMSPSRGTRGIVLLVGLLGTLVFGVLAAVGVLMLWAPLVPLAMAVAGFVWLRAGVRAEAQARAEARRAATGRARRPAPRARTTTSAAPAVSGTSSAPTRPAAPVVEREAEEEPEAVVEQSVEVPFDVTAGTDATHTGASQAVGAEDAPVVTEPQAEQPVAEQPAKVAVLEADEDDIPLTWDPRPVPRPTYTMKARAPERPAAARLVEPVDEAERTAYDEVPQRRISGL